MTTHDSPTLDVVVATANFGGAARAVPAIGGGSGDRLEAIADFIRTASGVPAIDALPMVVTLQEMIRLLDVQPPGRPVDYPAEIARRLSTAAAPVDSYYVPTVTMQQYPLEKKWRERWEEGILEMEQGMFACALRGARLFVPHPRHSDVERFKGRRIDLPVGEGRYYGGTRDTEPRAATAHLVCIGDGPDGQFVLINVHLATLKAEDAATDKRQASDSEARTVRQSTAEARALRQAQLNVIGNFIHDEVYELGLPVIVAGDFNADPDELSTFMHDAGLRAVFDAHPGQCWECGAQAPRGNTPIEFFTYPRRKEILGEAADVVRALLGPVGRTDCAISVDECCSHCRAPFFTHKRNFSLIDNLLYSGPDSPSGREPKPRKWQVAPEVATRTRGIRLDTYFSDHLPLWCKFSVRRT